MEERRQRHQYMVECSPLTGIYRRRREAHSKFAFKGLKLLEIRYYLTNSELSSSHRLIFNSMITGKPNKTQVQDKYRLDKNHFR